MISNNQLQHTYDAPNSARVSLPQHGRPQQAHAATMKLEPMGPRKHIMPQLPLRWPPGTREAQTVRTDACNPWKIQAGRAESEHDTNYTHSLLCARLPAPSPPPTQTKQWPVMGSRAPRRAGRAILLRWLTEGIAVRRPQLALPGARSAPDLAKGRPGYGHRIGIGNIEKRYVRCKELLNCELASSSCTTSRGSSAWPW